MSDNIPFEIQIEIIKRLPVKSLIRFRSVSKPWKSLIDSSDFVAHYRPQQRHLLVSYHHIFIRNDPKYDSVADDDTFPQHKVSLSPPLLVKMLDDSSIIGSFHGLLCLYGSYDRGCVDHHIHETNMAVVWNISIRKAVAVVMPNVGHGMYHTILGFGVCRETNDPKIVKIKEIGTWEDPESISCIPWQVEVFTLGTRAWRRPYSTNLPRKSIEFCRFKVGIDDTLYWLAMDRTTMDGGFMSCNLIISFDMTTEEFGEVNLPDILAHDRYCYYNLYIFKLNESLVVLHRGEDKSVVIGWEMEDGVSKMFTKLFSIYTPDATILRVLEFRKSGEPILEIEENGDSTLDYEPHSKLINNLGIEGVHLSFSVCSYTESLLLLDPPNFNIYDKGKCYILKQ